MFNRVGISCRISYSLDSYLYVSFSGLITSVGESYRLLVIMWFIVLLPGPFIHV